MDTQSPLQIDIPSPDQSLSQDSYPESPGYSTTEYEAARQPANLTESQRDKLEEDETIKLAQIMENSQKTSSSGLGSDSSSSSGLGSDSLSTIEPLTTAPLGSTYVPKTEEETNAYNDALDMYYSYKQQYQQSIDELKKKVSMDNNKSDNAEKRAEYKKKKVKCVNCGRPVGSIFATEIKPRLTKDDFRRILVAKCGDKVAPCNLDIQISTPFIEMYDDIIRSTKESVEQYKARIIKIKNDVMFGYLKEDEAIKRYTVIGGILADEVKVLETTIINRDEFTEKYRKLHDLSSAEDAFEKDVTEFSHLTKQFKITHNDQFLKESTLLYTERILVDAKNVLNSKYAYCEIEQDPDTKVCKLTQTETPLNSNQNYTGEDVYESILKFVKDDTAVKLNKTLKRPNASRISLAKNKTKTRKQKLRDDRITARSSSSSSSSSPPSSSSSLSSENSQGASSISEPASD